MKRCRHIEVERLVEFVIGALKRRPRQGPTNVVHQEVDPTKLLERPLHQPVELLGHEGVGRHHQGPAAGFFDDARYLLKSVLTPRRQHHIRSGFRQRNGDPTANPPTRAGNDGHAIGHFKTVQNHRMASPAGNLGHRVPFRNRQNRDLVKSVEPTRKAR